MDAWVCMPMVIKICFLILHLPLLYFNPTVIYFCCFLFCTKRMLDEMENDLDKTTQRLDFVTQKTKEMIKRSGGKQNFLIIVALIVVAFILILLILYT